MEQWFAAILGDAILAGEALDRACAMPCFGNQLGPKYYAATGRSEK
ncbi:hypothetical protein [Aromatoleum petrolei]|uniref:Uncharacterized protein n=1 Tax=Aromatoleum petrolei TaxID=76116 RepID=A0ABX1MNW0_9RHOO|nr:hypothetical protein [Aromatoleum petrolei]NMF89632.1 hypothetical protein [Aromatoleum petrolei]QTQ39075.1 Uncharacterized protein ToN1_49820 [Aromatoleum petrolei]